MTPAKVAEHFNAHRVTEGRWRGKCPSHDGRSHNSLSIQAATDGKTLVKCWGGCRTEDVLRSAGLTWANLFPPSSSPSSTSPSRRRIDPKAELQHRAEIGLREWKQKASRTFGYRIWLRHRLVAEGERLIANGRPDQGWDFLQLGYEGLSRLEWLCDLLDSKHPQDWFTVRRILKGTPSL